MVNYSLFYMYICVCICTLKAPFWKPMHTEIYVLILISCMCFDIANDIDKCREDG